MVAGGMSPGMPWREGMREKEEGAAPAQCANAAATRERRGRRSLPPEINAQETRVPGGGRQAACGV